MQQLACDRTQDAHDLLPQPLGSVRQPTGDSKELQDAAWMLVPFFMPEEAPAPMPTAKRNLCSLA